MSDKLIIGKVVFSENDSKTTEACKVYIPPPGQRGVRLLKKGTPAFDAVDAIKRHEEALLKLLAVKHPRLLRALAEKSFDTVNDSP